MLDDPAGLTRTVVEAGAAAGVRLLISKARARRERRGLSRSGAGSSASPARCCLACSCARGQPSLDRSPPLPRAARPQGWGGLGEGLEAGALPGGVLLLDKPCPHDWLFKRCTGVVHHGGAGTTAAGIKAGACG